jgi:hypothetical protein
MYLKPVTFFELISTYCSTGSSFEIPCSYFAEFRRISTEFEKFTSVYTLVTYALNNSEVVKYRMITYIAAINITEAQEKYVYKTEDSTISPTCAPYSCSYNTFKSLCSAF